MNRELELQPAGCYAVPWAMCMIVRSGLQALGEHALAFMFVFVCVWVTQPTQPNKVCLCEGEVPADNRYEMDSLYQKQRRLPQTKDVTGKCMFQIFCTDTVKGGRTRYDEFERCVCRDLTKQDK